MITVSRAVERLSGSQRGLADTLPKPKVARMIGLHRGDPSFATPEYVVQASIQAMRDGYTHYPPVQGDPQLREAVAAYQSRICGVPFSAADVQICAGGTAAVTLAMTAYLNEGDEVILFDPTYSLYQDTAAVLGAKAVPVPLTPDFAVDVEAVRRAVTPRTKMMILNFPSNPTGQLLEPQELDGLASIAEEHDLVVVSDEVYDQLVFKGKHISVASHPAMVDRTLVVNSASKTYAMTGWRIGWVVATGKLIEPVKAVQRACGTHANNIAQRATYVALTDEEEDRKWRTWMLGQYQERRQAIHERLMAIPGVHVYDLEAAFYAWVRYEAPISAVDMMKYLYERGLNVRPGTEFGAMGEKHLRFTFAPSVQVISEGIGIFKAAMEELRRH